jgi:hypothetical protein
LSKNVDAAAVERAERERAMDEANRRRIAANLRARVAEQEADARARLMVLVKAGKLDKPSARGMLWRRFDPKVKNAQQKFEKALVDAGMSPAARLEARGGAKKIGVTARGGKPRTMAASAAQVAATVASVPSKFSRPKPAKRMRQALVGPRIASKILGRGPWTILKPGATKWEPPLALDKKYYRKTKAASPEGKGVRRYIQRSKAAYRAAELTGPTYRRVALPRAKAKGRHPISADTAKYIAQEIGEVAIKRKFKNTLQGRPTVYGGAPFLKYLKGLKKGQKPKITAKSLQAADIAMKMVGGDVNLPLGDPARIKRAIPMRGGRNAGKILVVRGEGTTMITPSLTPWGRKPLLPFMHKASWTRRMRVVMPSTNEEWLNPDEMSPGHAAAVLDRIIDSLSPGKGGHITTFGGVDVTERPGYSMFREIGEKAVVAVQDAIRKRKYGWALSPRTVAYRAKMGSGGQMYTEGKFGRNRKTWHDFPARRTGDQFPINRPSGRQVAVASSPDHPLLWTGTLVNSVESFVDYDERSVSYGVFHSNSARHPVDGKMMYDIARYLLKKYNFLAHHVVRDDVMKVTVDVMVDYFNKIIHGGMDIQMRGRPGSKLATKAKIGGIAATGAMGRYRKEDIGEMEPVGIGYEQRKEESERSRENAP